MNGPQQEDPVRSTLSMLKRSNFSSSRLLPATTARLLLPSAQLSHTVPCYEAGLEKKLGHNCMSSTLVDTE
ncbi:hypothetical protein PFLUV_G00101350 [Perca fluviatilis]|uniref:Uncharacterized protein n=1 Tax=Perca fluviatilis TaxID=8168 RepID=A0A6A5F7A7_PERFL|nr:hypothetical protein PFLUV_G00101350 [Perca fluviatilis]